MKIDLHCYCLQLFYFFQCSRTLKQLHYFNWPDHGVPDSIPPILDMLQEMRSYQAHDDIPFCIHCRSGFSSSVMVTCLKYSSNSIWCSTGLHTGSTIFLFRLGQIIHHSVTFQLTFVFIYDPNCLNCLTAYRVSQLG